MPEVRWIKIVTDIFDNRKIRQIEKMPEGDAIIVIWLKLLCLAGKVNDEGFICLTEEVPYTEDMLATEFNKPIQIVKLALVTFQKFGMIEVIDSVYKVSSWEKYQNVDGLEKIREQTRLRVAKHRETKRLKMDSQICSYCGGVATGYDHILAIARGGTDTDSNKVPCCKLCNQIKNDKPLVDFLNNNRERINDDLVTGNSKLRRFVTLCNVTDRYEVTHCNETDKEEDIDIEKDTDSETEKEREKEIDFVEKKNKQKKADPVSEFEPLLSEYLWTEEMKDTVRDWIRYKAERNEYYKPTSRKTLLKQVDKSITHHGETAVEEAILNAMANNYQGMGLERISTNSGGRKQTKNTGETKEEYLNRMAKEWGYTPEGENDFTGNTEIIDAD